MAFVVFGAWWIALEVLRRKTFWQLNQEYEAEVAEQRAAAARRQQEWEERLAVEQAQAGRQYEKQLVRWNQIVAAQQAANDRQMQEWEDWLFDEQTRARKQYEEKLRPWEQIVSAIRREAEKRRKANVEAERSFQIAETDWVSSASATRHRFENKKAELQTLKDRHESLARDYAADRQRLQFNAREMQLNDFLQKQFINNADIPDIGPTRKATLRSFSIETAFDVEETAILNVPGFGPKLTERLIRWRREIESQFVFNAADGIPPQVQQALDLRFAQARQQVETKLLNGEGELRTIVKQAEGELRQLYGQIKSCLRSLVQTELDLRILPPNV